MSLETGDTRLGTAGVLLRAVLWLWFLVSLRQFLTVSCPDELAMSCAGSHPLLQVFRQLCSGLPGGDQPTATGQWACVATPKCPQEPSSKCGSAADTPQESKGAAAPMHATVAKQFDGVVYSGKVIGYDAGTGWYTVRYHDGDQEELTAAELATILVLVQPEQTAVNEKHKHQPSTALLVQRRGHGKCRECDQEPVAGNYGFCHQHRSPMPRRQPAENTHAPGEAVAPEHATAIRRKRKRAAQHTPATELASGTGSGELRAPAEGSKQRPVEGSRPEEQDKGPQRNQVRAPDFAGRLHVE